MMNEQQLSLIQEWVGRARAAQQAINDLGAGPPGSRYDAQEAAQARDEAMQRVEAHANTQWRLWALRALYAVCRRGLKYGNPEFTSEDVVRMLERWKAPATHEMKALGPIMSIGQRRGWCAKTDRWLQTADKTSHGRDKRIWRALDTIPEWDGQA